MLKFDYLSGKHLSEMKCFSSSSKRFINQHIDDIEIYSQGEKKLNYFYGESNGIFVYDETAKEWKRDYGNLYKIDINTKIVNELMTYIEAENKKQASTKETEKKLEVYIKNVPTLFVKVNGIEVEARNLKIILEAFDCAYEADEEEISWHDIEDYKHTADKLVGVGVLNHRYSSRNCSMYSINADYDRALKDFERIYDES
jgi:hypothetical protein